MDGLRQVYPSFAVRGDADDQLHLDVTVGEGDDDIGPLSVYVTLSSTFPRSPPTISTANGILLRCAPIGRQWNGELDVLAEAVREAVQHLQQLWGSVKPPTLKRLAPSLAQLSDDALHDIASNSQCQETFAYQLPVAKQMREELMRLADELEASASANAALAARVQSEEASVADLRRRLGETAAWLEPKRSLLQDLCMMTSDDGITRLLTKEAKSSHADSEEVERRIVGLDPSSAEWKRQLTDLREKYVTLRRQFHCKELTRRSFAASQKR